MLHLCVMHSYIHWSGLPVLIHYRTGMTFVKVKFNVDNSFLLISSTPLEAWDYIVRAFLLAVDLCPSHL